MKLKKIAALLTVAGISAPAFATNGMALEGYGPIATGMGGASMAYDNGNAGMINNAATLGLIASGSSRLDLAIGSLNPNVSARNNNSGATAKSDGTSYLMPAIGYTRKDGKLTWGVGLMSQGGMGTEWGAGTWLASPHPGRANSTQLPNRVELGVGRVMLPLAYDISDTFRLGGSLDYLWAGMDMQMVLDGNSFNAMFANGNNANKNAIGFANGIGTATTIQNFLGGIGSDHYYLNANKGNDKFSQQLTANATSANIGFVWAATKSLSIGATYRPKVDFGSLSGSGSISRVSLPGGPLANGTWRMDFSWPSVAALGVSYQATDKLQLVADFSTIGWKDAMRTFRMRFTSGSGNADFGFNMNWVDQNVIKLGMAYKLNDTTTLRLGANLANQVVKPENMLPLFPATTKDHFTFGAGFATSKTSSLDFSASVAPSVSIQNGPNTAALSQGFPAFNAAATPGTSTVTHSQVNWQLQYSQRF